MKAPIFLTILIALLAFSACRKESSVPEPADEQTWRYADSTFNAAFAEVNIRYGYKITFRPGGATGLDYGVTLHFSEKPQDGNNYLASRDTTSRTQVKVILQTGSEPSYSSIGGDGKQVTVDLKDGKLRYSGADIRLVRDTIPAEADTLLLRFKLTEF